MFGLFKKQKNEIASPVHGTAVSLSEVKDEVFRTEVLGKGVGIIPNEPGKVYAPCDGKLEMVFDTGHAVSMTSAKGVELLIHVGIDTVKLKGEHFTTRCAVGDTVKQGDLLLEFDKAAITAAGYDTTVMLVVCNTDAYKDITCQIGEKSAGDMVLEIIE
ncbi:MAG: PTS glucose transporter subunit IIA [Faecalibacterium sp.]